MLRARIGSIGLVAVGLVVTMPGLASAAPGGSPNSFAVITSYDSNLEKRVVDRWDPCTAVRVKVNPGAYGQAGVAEAKKAVVMVGQASGLRFVYAGVTSWFPRGDVPDGQKEATGADLVVGFLDASRSSYIPGGALGYGGYRATSSTGSARRITSGTAFLRMSKGLSPGFGRGATRGQLLLHEVGHAVGLDHVRDRSQVMANGSSAPAGEFQRGDLMGLKKVGKDGGCIVSKVSDRDGDGIPDSRDQDPNDPKNPSTTDSDGDGTVDGRDLHPQDPYADGMGLEYEDADGDGIANHEDPAPGDPAVPGRSATATATTSSQ